MKNKKNLLLLILGLTIVGCNGGGGTSEISSTPDSTPVSESSSEAGPDYFEDFLEAYNALGKNYYAIDYLSKFWGDQIDASCNVSVVTDKGTINLATNSGIALADNGQSAYRFGIDLEAEAVDPEKMFLPSYNKANFYYYGFNASEPALFELNANTYDFLYRIPSSSEIKQMSDNFYSMLNVSKLPTFKGMFTQGQDSEGNITFTTGNIVFAMEMLEYCSFGRLEGYSDIYNYNAYNHFEETIMQYGENGIETVVTMLEGDGYYALDFQVYLRTFSEEYPYVERQLVPLSMVPDYEIESYDLVSYIIPEDFYTNGPGEEPANSVEARANLKAELDNVLSSSFTLNFAGSSDLLQGEQYTSKVFSDTCYTFLGEGFSYSYYYVPVDENQTDITKGGIYVYATEDGYEDEEMSLANTKEFLDEYVKMCQEANYPYSVDGYVLSFVNEGGEQTLDVNEYLELLFYDNFSYVYYLRDEFSADYVEAYGKSYWEVLYGGDWIDQFYYNERTGKFLLSNYYIRYALLGSNTLFFNYGDIISIDILPGFTAEETPIIQANIFWYGQTLPFGVFTFSELGTTKADYNFGTYVNETYGLNLPVEEAAA